jgi:Ca2+-binding EF-hand superfamily protein
LTGETYSDAKLRGIMYEVDFDRSGEIDFDEFVLAMITLKKGK